MAGVSPAFDPRRGDASAQSAFYVGGAAIADIRRFDSFELDPRILASLGDTSRDGTAAGGGVRVGTFLHPRWSLELAVDAASGPPAHSGIRVEMLPSRSSTLRLPELSNSTSFLTVSTVVGFHPEKMGRVQPWLSRRNRAGKGHERIDASGLSRTFRSISHSCRGLVFRIGLSNVRFSHAIDSQHIGRPDAEPHRQLGRRRVRARSGHRSQRSPCGGPRRPGHCVLQRGQSVFLIRPEAGVRWNF